MNLKHEMFWNVVNDFLIANLDGMNLKHEMFWNKSIKFAFYKN